MATAHDQHNTRHDKLFDLWRAQAKLGSKLVSEPRTTPTAKSDAKSDTVVLRTRSGLSVRLPRKTAALYKARAQQRLGTHASALASVHASADVQAHHA